MKTMTMLLVAAATTVALTGCAKKDGNAPNSPNTPASPSSMMDRLISPAEAATPDDHSGGQSSGMGQVLSDSEITTKVKAALASDEGLKTLMIHVSTEQGVVTLSGKVKSQATYEKVISVVQSVKGVRNINNSLEVSSS